MHNPSEYRAREQEPQSMAAFLFPLLFNAKPVLDFLWLTASRTRWPRR
jgi:hypothetical protein